MRTSTTVSLGASAVLGLGALVVARLLLPQSPHAAPGRQVVTDTTPVVVAKGDIPYGAKLDQTRLVVEQLPRDAVPKGAYSTANQILSAPGGAPIVLTPIAAREPVLPAKLSSGGAKPTLAAVIDEGMRAFTIGVTDVAEVGGHVLPGDRVDVVLTRSIPVTPKAGGPGCGDCKLYFSNIVLQDVRVLGLDLNADPSSTQAAVAHTATMEVTIQDAERLAAAAQAGTLSLALRRTGASDTIPVRSVMVRSPTAVDPLLTEARRLSRSAPRPPLGNTRSVVVVHGDTSDSVEVPAERFGAGA
jgi:pilus assembly protein CpaB